MTDAAQITWAQSSAERQEAAAFFARVVALDPAYISHGEIQTALSFDGKTWAPDLAQRFADDLAAADPSWSLAIARTPAGALIGAAIVLWETEEPEAPYATLADIAIDPDQRSGGVGLAMATFIEAEAKARGMRWMFLESGKNNHRAHSFFERFGFAPISTVFVKKL